MENQFAVLRCKSTLPFYIGKLLKNKVCLPDNKLNVERYC